MRIAGFVFAPRVVPTLAAVAMVALTVSLGRWQADRAQEKAGRQALLEARVAEAPARLTGMARSAEDLLFRRVRAEGRFVPTGQIFIDNRIHGGRAGFHVVTPLAIGGAGPLVLVIRGWVARSVAYPAPPDVPVPAGEQVVEGLATVPPARVLELSTETVAGNVWQNLSIARYAKLAGRDVLPVMILASPPAPGLVAVEEKPDAGILKHREYSLTWFSLAATVVALWVGVNLRRDRP
ncbi:MAG TPA: SURF1 family protein [Usitatibacteraceae bacterium]|nr:SURF1 family protein [Usitatibacteraceae bacterium]